MFNVPLEDVLVGLYILLSTQRANNLTFQQLVNGIEAEVRLILINEVMADEMPALCNTCCVIGEYA